MNKIITSLSFIGVIFLYLFFNARTLGFCAESCSPVFGEFQNLFLIFPIIFIFSLVTYFLPPRVFAAWWAFAKYAIPIIFVISFGINAGWHHNPAGQWQDIFDLPALFILYGIFIVGSLIQIVRGWYGR